MLAWVAAGCRARPTGTLEFRWHLPADATAGLRSVRAVPDWGGANRGPLRDAGWTRVPLVRDDVPLASAAGAAPVDRPVAVARGTLAAGRWDRVFVAASGVTAVAPDGSAVTVTNHIEPIARGFDLPAGGHVTIDIVLVVLPTPSFVGTGWQIFVKDAVVR